MDFLRTKQKMLSAENIKKKKKHDFIKVWLV